MNGLAGTRVVIVDDEEHEALPIIKQLSKKGISSIYFGNMNDLPSEKQKLLGIRLLILDIDLVGGSVPDKSKISTLLGFLRKILHPDNGPYGILLWTNHPDLKRLFEEEVFNTFDIPNPVFTACVSKNECKDKKGVLKLSKISPKINDALKGFSPLLILQRWEEACFTSATQVTNALAGFAIKDSNNLADWRNLWKTETIKVMKALAIAEAGQQLNANSCLDSFYISMNPLHSDRMESNVFNSYKSRPAYSNEIMAAPATTELRAKAKLNTMLHLSFEGVDNFYAGNIYTQSKLGVRIPTVKGLLDDFASKKEKLSKEDLSSFKSVVVEINAACDHSQNKIRIARFLAGLIVKKDLINQLKYSPGSFMYRLGPLFLESRGFPADDYYFCFSARHLLSFSPREVLHAIPLARLRGPAFAALQAWFSHQVTRPGILML